MTDPGWRCTCTRAVTNVFVVPQSLIIVTVHEKTRYKSKIAILDNAHLKMQTSCYFMLK